MLHGGLRPVIRNIIDDGIPWPAIGAIDELKVHKKKLNKDDFKKFLKYSEGEDRSSLKNIKKLTKLSTTARVSSAESKYKR